MKKTVLILISVLIVVFGVLAIFGSKSENAAERLLYRTMKDYQKIVRNPDVAPPKMLAGVENSLQKIIEKYPQGKAAKIAQVKLAEFFLINKKYDQALAALDEIIIKYGEDAAMADKAQFLQAVVYERQNQREKAREIYLNLKKRTTQPKLIEMLEAKIAALEK